MPDSASDRESATRGEGSRRRRWRWGTVGNFVAAMGVIGGLAFNGWGLRTQSDQLAIQAQQAKEQTKTIQDEEERNLQERAVRVSVQPLAPLDTGRRLVVVVNRSATPIYQLS
ncbi:hypothetical protein [Streptomyces sp. NPDC003717]|uniref:hypothetical protein n=1 Tax=Streptomyces sp. NPDC003717 TaxID=3154276 RepID=UPI0033B8836C